MSSNSIPDTDFQAAANTQEENLEIEFKRTLDLSSKEGKAKLAKEICALSNFGGGWIVFGREDDGEYVSTLSPELNGLDQETVNQVSAAYLSPAPHCTLRWVRPHALSFDLPVIWVPSLGSEPVCASKNGPQGDKGQTLGVQLGVHYTRSAGPVSAPIASPDQWKEIIRRCVLSDKTQLLGALSVMMSEPAKKLDEAQSPLDADFEYLVDKWVSKTSGTHRSYLSKSFLAFGFELVGLSNQVDLTTDQIKDVLCSRNTSRSGPHRFFEEGYPDDARPYVFDVAGKDGLQADLIKKSDGTIYEMATLWRFSEAGVGVEVFSYWEDTDSINSAVERRSSRKWERGKNIWIEIQAEYLDGFMGNIVYFATNFNFEGQVRVRVLYSGLDGRQLNSPRSSMSYSRNYVSKQNQKTVDLLFELDALEETVRSSAIATILQQLNKLFQGPVIDATTVVRKLGEHRRGS